MPDQGRPNSGCFLAIAAVLAVFIFCIDAFTSLDIAIAVMYVVVVLLSASRGSRRLTWVVALLASSLRRWDTSCRVTARSRAPLWARAFVSVLAIATTLWLSLRNLANTATLQEQVKLLELTHDAIVVYRLDGIIGFWSRGARGTLWAHGLRKRWANRCMRLPADALSHGSFRYQPDAAAVGTDGKGSSRNPAAMAHRSRCRAAGRYGATRRANRLRWLATNNDITQRKQAENALARNEAFLADAQQLSQTGSIGFRLPAGEMAWSVEAHRIFGYAPDAIPSMDLVLARVHVDDIPLVTAAYKPGACRLSRGSSSNIG